jgi:hypothetical protein
MSAYAAFREVLPEMPEAQQAKMETTHAIAYAATGWRARCSKGCTLACSLPRHCSASAGLRSPGARRDGRKGRDRTGKARNDYRIPKPRRRP